MLTTCDYPVELAPDGDTLLVTSPDFPELTTFGTDEADALLAQGAVDRAQAQGHQITVLK